MDLWRELTPGREAPRLVRVVVVTPKDSVNIYAYHKTDIISLEHTIHKPFRPPGDMGFIPQTYGEGDAPLDAMVLSTAPSPPKTVIDARPIGLLRKTLDGVRDDSVLCVPNADHTMLDVTDVRHVTSHVLEEIEQFFVSLFRDQNRVLRIDEWLGAEEAQRAIERAVSLYKRKFQTVEL